MKNSIIVPDSMFNSVPRILLTQHKCEIMAIELLKIVVSQNYKTTHYH